MDYIDIILKGYLDTNNQTYLSKYFIREFKKAEKEHYDFEEFFKGLLNGIESLKQDYKTKLYNRKNELYFMLNDAKNGTLKYGNSSDIPIANRHKDTIEYCEDELKTITENNFYLNLFQFTKGKYVGHLSFSELCFIIEAVIHSFNTLNQPEATDLSESKAKENKSTNIYVSLIVNTYFDALESLGNNFEMITLIKDLFIQTITRNRLKREKEDFMTPYEFNSRIYFALELMKECGYYDDFETENNSKLMRIESIMIDIKRPITRIEFKNIGDWIDELTTTNESQKTEVSDLWDNTKNENYLGKQPNEKTTIKDLTTEKWFDTGIALATGKAFNIYRQLGANMPTEICRRIGVPTSNKTYVSATLTDKDDSKNIFKDAHKLKALHKEITEKGLNFGTEFLAKYNQIETD